MNLRFTNTICFAVLLAFTVACQDTMPSRQTITKGSASDDILICPEGQEVVSEIVDNQIVETCQDIKVNRPTDAVFWKTDFCACKDSVAVSYGNCSSFCAGKKTSGAETLFANFRVTEAISLGGLGNMYAWCSVALEGDAQNPECEIEAKDSSGNITTIEVTIPPNSNSLQANIQDKLQSDKAYILTLVERSTGAKSDSVQFIKYTSEIPISVLGPLKNIPVSQYSCILRNPEQDTSTGDLYFMSAYRQHFYFIQRMPPDPLPPGIMDIACHDIFNPLYGTNDDPLYPRLETVPGIFNLWDNTDPRFYDNNNNGNMDVNDIIVQKSKNFGATINPSSNFFTAFRWQTTPLIQTEENNNNGSETEANAVGDLGYYMSPWIDQTTFKAYCVNSTHYNSDNPLFKALRDVIGVDTEGLYVGEKIAESSDEAETTAAYRDLLLIREADLKSVWFYLNGSVPTRPTENNVANNAIFFYYPLNKASPYVKTSTQRLYRIRSAKELNGQENSTTPGGSPTSYPPHDRRIGCVPKF